MDNQRTLIFDSLSFATKYYARFKTNISDYGKVTSFTTRAEPFSALNEPANQATDVDPVVVHMVIAAVPGAKRYTLQLSTSSSLLQLRLKSAALRITRPILLLRTSTIPHGILCG